MPIIVRESISRRKLLNESAKHSKVVYKLANNPNFVSVAVLSGKRCSEMSIVYDDIQAVTRLLQEKEKVIGTLSHIVDAFLYNLRHGSIEKLRSAVINRVTNSS